MNTNKCVILIGSERVETTELCEDEVLVVETKVARGTKGVTMGKPRDALHLFAWEHGRCWKQALRDSWARACADLPETLSGVEYRGALQRFRNDPGFGTVGLQKYRLPEGFTFKGRG